MKARSDRRRFEAEYPEAVRDWAFCFSSCWRCGRRGLWPTTLSIHHFVLGSSRRKNDLFTTAICCHECHELEHTSELSLGLLGWLLLKKIYDGEFYDLVRVCAARGRAEGAITDDEVESERRRLQEIGVLSL